MLFNSIKFLLFFAIFIPLYYLVPKKSQWQFVLAASLVFYMSWRPELIFLLLGVIAVNYCGSILVENAQTQKAKKSYLTIAIVLDFTVLAIFKYLMFISKSFGWLYGVLGMRYPIGDFSIALPAGLSFYTFQAAGYLVDIYRGDYKAEKNPLKFATFMSFFPQITAGPIERGSHMLPQLFTPKKLNSENISMGLKIMLWGYFKKVVLADRLSILVSKVFSAPQNFEGGALIIAVLAFTVQIYCDFSGYSDIARGTARVMGIDLINNFNRPYFATSIRDFWRRWHISLSSWFRDYLYIPLGGNRVSTPRLWLNYMITFMASGLWHGASWSFVVWGALHGFYQIVGNIKYKIFGKPKFKCLLTDFAAAFVTFILVAFAWIFFKANTVNDGIYIATHLFDNIGSIANKQYLYEMVNSLGLGLYEIKLMAGAVLWLIISEIISFKYEINELMTKAPFVLRFSFYYVTAVIILGMGVFSSGGDFIYFNF